MAWWALYKGYSPWAWDTPYRENMIIWYSTKNHSAEKDTNYSALEINNTINKLNNLQSLIREMYAPFED